MLLANDPAKDKAAAFLWPFLCSLWNYAAERIGEAADDAASIDQAMRAGFNWELGPFELWDAAGVRRVCCADEGDGDPGERARVQDLLDSAPDAAPVSWYSPDGPQCFNPVTGAWEPIAAAAGACAGCGFQAEQWGGAQQSGRVAGGSGRRDWVHRAALAEECDWRRCGGDDFVGAEPGRRMRCGILRGL